jgi:hypothetical protein
MYPPPHMTCMYRALEIHRELHGSTPRNIRRAHGLRARRKPRGAHGLRGTSVGDFEEPPRRAGKGTHSSKRTNSSKRHFTLFAFHSRSLFLP